MHLPLTLLALLTPSEPSSFGTPPLLELRTAAAQTTGEAQPFAAEEPPRKPKPQPKPRPKPEPQPKPEPRPDPCPACGMG